MKDETAYVLFDHYMKRVRGRYNQKMFAEDDMYFCKIFRSHFCGFADICKDHKVNQAFFILFSRYEDYEHRIIQRQFDEGLITDKELFYKKTEITNRYKRGL